MFGIAGTRVNGGVRERDPVLIWVGLLTLAGLPINLVGAILGFVGISKPTGNRWMAITGAILNLLMFLGVLLLIVVGLANRRH